MTIEKNLAEVRQKISSTCSALGRDSAEIKIVAATKGRPAEQLEQLLNLGINSFGENYVQELLPKSMSLSEKGLGNVEWHFFGHLQSNKVKKVVPIVSLIQSVDSEKIAKKISSCASSLGKIQDVLIEVNVGEEKQKFGVQPTGLEELCNRISELTNLRVKGLMCMAPLLEPVKTKPFFQKIARMFNYAKEKTFGKDFEILSMGMSNDYLEAIQEGSNMVRLGRAIFD